MTFHLVVCGDSRANAVVKKQAEGGNHGLALVPAAGVNMEAEMLQA